MDRPFPVVGLVLMLGGAAAGLWFLYAILSNRTSRLVAAGVTVWLLAWAGLRQLGPHLAAAWLVTPAVLVAVAYARAEKARQRRPRNPDGRADGADVDGQRT